MPASSYTVAPGDTLYGIARRFGMDVNDLISMNGLSSNNLSIGQTLQVWTDDGQDSFVPPPPPPPEPQWPEPQQPDNTWGGGGGGQSRAAQKFPLQVQQDAGFNRYFLTVPLLSGQQVTANMRDNLTNSSHMVYPNGIMYAGQSNIELDVYSIQSVGLTPEMARALQYVSSHEGRFDAINSYDKAIFSYGFIQFVGAAAPGGSLNRVLQSMKANATREFYEIFNDVGIDSQGGTTTVRDDYGNQLSGDQAWLYIEQNVPIYGAFIQAGFEPALVLEQLRMANTLYVQPALNYKLNVNVGGIQVLVPRLQDILNSEAILTAVIAIAINQGAGGMSRVVADAVSQVAAQSQFSQPGDLGYIDQRAVCEAIAYNAADSRVRDRAMGVLNSGLSFS